VSSAGTHVFSEPELVELLAAEPELLAVADIAEAHRKRRRSPKRLAAAAVAVAVAGVLVVAAPGAAETRRRSPTARSPRSAPARSSTRCSHTKTVRRSSAWA
jgi:hypothetical protein